MTTRIRSKSDYELSGRRKTNGITSGSTTSRIESALQRCEDWVGPGDCGALHITHWSSKGGYINTPSWPGNIGTGFDNYLADYYRNRNSFGHVATDAPTRDAAATMAAARTNPSRPYVDVPVMIAELGDITKLIRDSGRSILRKAAGANIKYQFGIKPLADDIAKLCNFSQAFDIRAKEVERLRGPRGLRRTIEIGTYSNESSRTEVIQSAGAYITNTISGRTQETVRAHTRWFPGHGLPKDPKSDAMRRLTRKALLGLEVNAAAVWELIPWSWLIDWHGTIGPFLSASRNIIPSVLTHAIVIRTRETTWSAPARRSGQNNNIVTSAFEFKRTEKTRMPGLVQPTAHVPILSGTQMGIVASLAVLRLGR